MRNKAIKPLRPKEAQIERQKAKFIAELRINGNNVSKALRSSGLERNTAYRHRLRDSKFDEAWRDAQAEYYDELLGEARDRALKGVEVVSSKGEKRIVKSDKLLLHLLKSQGLEKKWRDRLIDVGKIAIEAIEKSARKNNISEEIIKKIQKDVMEAFNDVPLV